MSESEIRKRADACLEAGLHKNQARLDDYCTAIRDQANDQRSMVRVCCFAKSIRNMMLWAHYANKQKGVAFQFLKSELKDKNTHEFRGMDVFYVPKAYGVEAYVHALDCCFGNGDFHEAARFYLATKTFDWEREDEVRFFTDNDRQHLSFRENALPGIILGADCSDDLIKNVQDEVRTWQRPPRLFKVSIDRSIHKLWIETFKCGQER